MSAEARAPAGEKGTADRIEADEGMFWVCLVTRQALDREGAAMQHCVGDGDYDALVGGEELHDDAIWSLRRADGSSALTVRVRRGELDYARGFSNHGPGKGACLQVRHLAAAFAGAGYRLAVDEDTGIVLLDDGRTFRRDRLPPEVVAAREAAERARRDERAAGWRRLRGDIEIRTDERPDRPLVGPGEVPIIFVVVAPFTSWVMESNPDGEPIGGVGRLRFEFRATRGQADPVVRIERDGEGPIRYLRGSSREVGEYVSDAPVASLLVAGAIGFGLGLLISKL